MYGEGLKIFVRKAPEGRGDRLDVYYAPEHHKVTENNVMRDCINQDDGIRMSTRAGN